ncbi:MAG: glycosyltransferase family 4 protein [Candidatus Omnitrophica bacterium]|nr:glycosyltransferase family 4 protein [Candidatus Omnitrophota bacterium]
MNILFVTARFPYPPLRGDQVIPYYRLKLLSRRHNITLITFYQHDKDLEHLKELSNFCKEIITVKLSKLASILNVLVGIFSELPFQVLYFRLRAFKKQMQSLVISRKFDIIHTYMLRMTEYTKDLNEPKILDLIDLMQLNLKKRVPLDKFIRKIAFKEELKRIIEYENQMIMKYDRSILVSDNDKSYAGSDKITAIPLGIDTNVFKRYSNLSDDKTIIFSGNMGYSPNESAVIWFIKECFWKIKHEVPGAKLVIVGNNPGLRVKKMGDNRSIFVTGFVKSMADELNKAQIAIAPMQSGYGMHIKILEAMACALPIITTTSGLGAIGAIHGKDVFIADNSLDFIRSCIKLLNDYDLAKKVGNNARDLVIKNHSWETHMNKLEKIYESILKSDN